MTDITQESCDALDSFKFGCGDGEVGRKHDAAFLSSLEVLRQQQVIHCNSLVPPNCTTTTARDITSVSSESSYTFPDITVQTQSVSSSSGAIPVSYAIDNTAFFDQVSSSSAPANRIRIVGQNGRVTFSAGGARLKDVRIIVRDLDVPVENIINWTKSPDSVLPAFGNNVESTLVFTNINAPTLEFDYVNAPGYADIIIYTEFVSTYSDCVPAQMCDGILSDMSGNALSANFEVC